MGLRLSDAGGAVAAWLLPFAVSCAFFDRTGKLAIPMPLFKSIMVVVGGSSGALLLQRALRDRRATAASGGMLGAFYMVVNWGLDLALLLPLSGQSPAEYAADIGLRYVVMPVTGALLGAMAAHERAAAGAGRKAQ